MQKPHTPTENRFDVFAGDAPQADAAHLPQGLDGVIQALRAAGSDHASMLAARLEANGWSALGQDELQEAWNFVNQGAQALAQRFVFAQNTPETTTDTPPNAGDGGTQQSGGPNNTQGQGQGGGQNGQAGNQEQGSGNQPPPQGQTPPSAPPVAGNNFGPGGATPSGGLGGTPGGLGGGFGLPGTGGGAGFGYNPGVVNPGFTGAQVQSGQTGQSSVGVSGLASSNSLGSSTEVNNAGLITPYVQQQVSLNGGLGTQSTTPTYQPPSSGTSGGGFTGTVGGSNVTVPTTIQNTQQQTAPTVTVQTPPNPYGDVSVQIKNKEVTEGSDHGVTELHFVVTRTNGIVPDSIPWKLTGALAASDLVDGDAGFSGAVTFAAGELVREVVIRLHADTTVEIDENAILTLGGGTYSKVIGSPAETLVHNDDYASIAVTADANLAIEGDPSDEGDYTYVTFTVTRTVPEGHAPDVPLLADRIDWRVGTGGEGQITLNDLHQGDYSGYIDFEEGQMEATVTVRVLRDVLTEDNKTIDLTLNTEHAVYSVLNEEMTQASTMLADDDAILTVTSDTGNVSEGTDSEGVREVVFHVTRTNGILPDSFDWQVAGIQDSDLVEGSLVGTIQFEEGETEKDIVFYLKQDATVEQDELLQLSLSDGNHAHSEEGSGIAATLITNDDYATIAVTADADLEIEGDSSDEGDYTYVSFTVTRTVPDGHDPDVPLLADRIDWSVGTGGEGQVSLDDLYPDDYSGYIDFEDGQMEATVTLRVLRDVVTEDNKTIDLSLSTEDSLYAVLNEEASSASTLVADDDAILNVVADVESVPEGTDSEGVREVVFHVTRTNGILADSFDWEVSGIQDSDLAEGNLYGTIEFDQGETEKDIVFYLNQDATVEEDELLQLSLSDGNHAHSIEGSGIAATLVTNDDYASLSITADAAAVIEGNPGDEGGDPSHEYSLVTFQVHRTAPDGQDPDVPLLADDVDWTILTGSGKVSPADIHPDDFQGTIHFAEGETDATLTIRVLRDVNLESDEALVVQLQDSTYGRTDTAEATTMVVDDDPTMSFSAAPVAVVEGPSMFFTVVRETGLGYAADLEYELLPAGLGTTSLPDSAHRTGIVHFDAGQTEAQIEIQTSDDQLVNGAQRFYVALSSQDTAVHIGQATVEGTVFSNDAEIGIESIEAGDVGADGLITYTVTLSRRGALNYEHEVSWSVAGIGEHPAADSDFVLPASQDLVFEANDDPQAESDTLTFTFQAHPGLIANGERGFEVRLAEDSDQVVLGVEAARANIVPNGVSVSIVPVLANSLEGSTETFRIQLSQASDQDVVVSWQAITYGATGAQAGVNANAADFGGSFPGGSVTIAAGQTSALVSVAPSSDSSVEVNEKFYVQIAVTSGPAGVVIPRAAGTIVNDDAQLGFSSLSFVADEGNSTGNGDLVAVVSREGFNRSTISATWHLELVDGEAGADDFVSGQDALGTNGGLPSGTVELLPGQIDGQIHIALAGDNVLEHSEKFRIVLDQAIGGAELKAGATQAEGVITNDDAVVSMGATTVNVTEGQAGHTTSLDIIVNREGDTRSVASVTWSALGTGDTPTNAADFSGQTAGTVYFAAGQSSTTIHLTVKGDDVVEGQEQVAVSLTGTGQVSHTLNSDASKLSTVATVFNDDDLVEFYGADLTVTEDNADHSERTIQFQLARTGDAYKETTVSWHLDLSGKTASASDFINPATGLPYIDGQAVTGTATFAIGDSEATVYLRVNNDKVVEGNETFAVVLDTPAAGSGTQLDATRVVTGTLVNDDVKVLASFSGASSEGDSGTTTYTYTLSREGDTDHQASALTWDVAGAQITRDGVVYANALSAGELASKSDSQSSLDQTVTWAAGDTSSRTITVTVNGDSVAEGDEAIRLALTSATGDRTQLTGNGVYGVIHDDDAVLAINAMGAAVVEGAAGTSRTVSFQLTRSGDMSSTVTVDLAHSGASGVTGPSAVTFDPDAEEVTIHYLDGRPDQTVQITGGSQTVQVDFTVAGDDVLESGEALLVTLQNAQASAAVGRTNANVVVDQTHASATTTITNDDDRITVSAPSQIAEGNSGNTDLTFNLTRDGDTTKETTVKWRIVGNGEVVVNGDDFAYGQESPSVPNDGMPSGTLTFAAGQTSKQITIQVAGDTDIEADEGLALNLTVTAGNTQTQDKAVTILGDDVGYNAIARYAQVVEGNDPTAKHYIIYDLVRAGDTTSAKTVDWSVAGITAADVVDGQDLSGHITFAAGETGKSIRLEVRQDSLVDVEKTATLTLDGTGMVTAPTAATVLKDDDAQLSITADASSVWEGTDPYPNSTATPDVSGATEDYITVGFTVTREGNLKQASTVTWQVNETGGINAADFWEGVLPTGSLSFAQNEDVKTISVRVRSDSLKEANETLTVSLGTPSLGTSDAVASAYTTITNDDAEVSFDPGSMSISHKEGDSGTTTYTFDLVRTGYLSQSSTVHWSVGGDVNWQDFSGFSNYYLPYGDVTFSSGETSKHISISVNNDTFVAYRNWWWNTVTGSSLEGDEHFSVNLSNPTTGTSLGNNSSAEGVIINDDVRIQITAVHSNLPEGTAPLPDGDVDPTQPGVQAHIPQYITLERQGDITQSVSIEWYVGAGGFTSQMDSWVNADGSVVNSADWVSAHGGMAPYGIITWEAGDASPKTIIFNPHPDNVVEQDYTFNLGVRPVADAANIDPNIDTSNSHSNLVDEFSVGTDSNLTQNFTFATESQYLNLGTFTIKRDESGVWISNEVVPQYDSGSRDSAVWDSLPPSIAEQFTGSDYHTGYGYYTSYGLNGVNYGGNDAANQEGSLGTATAGSDFTAVAGSLSFTDSTRVQTVSVNILNDRNYETKEGFGLFLDNASGANVAVEQATTTILDDDNISNGYRVTVQGSTAIEGMDHFASFKVYLGNALSRSNTFTVDLGSDGTAAKSVSGDAGDFTRYFDYSTDGGQTWQTNAPVYHFTANTETKAVDDQLTVTYRFDNQNGSNFDNWLDFSDLKAGEDVRVAGYANPDDLNNTWGGWNNVDGQLQTTIWIPVKATAVIDTQQLAVVFSGSQGAMSGQFAGIADLSNNSDTLNQEALAFFQQQGPGAQDVAGIQAYFHQFDGRNITSDGVQFLKFVLSAPDSDTADSTDLVWSISGLDATQVVAPQDGDNPWSSLILSQDATVAAGDSSVAADVTLGSQALFANAQSVVAVDMLEPTALQPSFSVTSDEINGEDVRTVHVTVNRPDGTLPDVVSYHLNLSELPDSGFLAGSALRDGSVSFAAGETSKELVFQFNALKSDGLEAAPASQDIHVIVDNFDGEGKAYVDLNHNGRLDQSEVNNHNLAFGTWQDGGTDYVDLALNHVTITLNDVPFQSLDLSGFGADDKIEVNLTELGLNGYAMGAVSRTSHSNYFNACDSGTHYYAWSSARVQGKTVLNSDFQVKLTAEVYPWGQNSVHLRLSQWNSDYNCQTNHNYSIGHFNSRLNALQQIDGENGLMSKVSFVHNPEIHVVVDRSELFNGEGAAFIDINANGVLDANEDRADNLAFSHDGSGTDLIDLEHNQVVVHFNDAPCYALDFSGFGKDDRIEIDVAALKNNGWTGISSEVSGTWENAYRSNWHNMSSSKGDSGLNVKVSADRRTYDYQWWTNSLKLRTTSESRNAELANFGTGAFCLDSVNAIIDGRDSLMGRISFVNLPDHAPAQDIHVIVDNFDGEGKAYVDQNHNGVLDENEINNDNLAFGQLYDWNNGQDYVDMAHNHVTVTFNDAPCVSLDFSGFGADDKIEINLSQFHENGWLLDNVTYANRDTNVYYCGSFHAGGTSSQYLEGRTAQNRQVQLSLTAYQYVCNDANLKVQGDHRSYWGGTYWANQDLAHLRYGNDARAQIDGQGSLLNQISYIHDPAIHVVVEKSGAYIDTNANGVLDAEEANSNNWAFTPWGSDCVGLDSHSVVVKFNDTPDYALDFSGFGRDDRIEIDLAALQANGWHVGTQITSQQRDVHNSAWYSGSSHSSSKTIYGHTRNGDDYRLSVEAWRYKCSDSWITANRLQISDHENHWGRLAYFGTGDTSESVGVNQIINGAGGLMNRVSFVRGEVEYVVVEKDGAWVDTNHDGILQASEKTDENLAFANNADGPATALVDMAHNKVVLHFNDAPTNALDLSGFGADDRIEIDRTAFQLNGWQGANNSGSPEHSDSYNSNHFHSSSVAMHGGNSSVFRVGGSRSDGYCWGTFNSLWAYASNGHRSKGARLATFGDNTSLVDGDFGLMDKVAFVKSTINVVVEADGAYIDVNGNHKVDSNEARLAFDGDTGADLINLANSSVVIHFNDAPNVALDLSGFGWDDKIEIDRFAFQANGWAGANNSASMEHAGNYSSYHHHSSSLEANNGDAVFRVGGSRSDGYYCGTYNSLWACAREGSDIHGQRLATFGDNTQWVNGNYQLMDQLSFVGKSYITGFDGQAVTLEQGGSLSSGGMTGGTNTISVGAGTDSILVRTPVVNDNIDEGVETVSLTVAQQSGDNFLVPEQTGSTVLVDNDSPQIAMGSNAIYDGQLQKYYLVQTVDINNRHGDTPDTYYTNSNYGSSSLADDAGSGQSMTVTLRFQGSWELALIDAEMGSTGQNYNALQNGEPMTHTDSLHNAPPGFMPITGTAERDAETGEPTGYFLYELHVPAGTEQILMRSELTSSQYNDNYYTLGNLLNNGFGMEANVTHVDPVIVARQTTVNESDGTANIEVIAVGGDLNNQNPVTVDYTTVDGQWVDRTFVISREFATAGSLTIQWTVQSLTDAATAHTGALPDGNGYYDYVYGYYGQTTIGTVSPNDFVIIGGQSADSVTGLPTGTVTFADGQKEAYVTVRVRADNVGEAPEDFRVVMGELPGGVQLLANPMAPKSYAELGYAGYARIVNDDQVFTISGAVYNEGQNSKAVESDGVYHTANGNGMAEHGLALGMTVPAGYTLHQFVINREGDSTSAASVDWIVQVKGIDGSAGFDATKVLGAQAAGAHEAESADFLSDGSTYGFSWQDSAVDGVLSSIAKTVVFAAGESQKVVTLAIKNDTLAEDAEQFHIVLTNPIALPGNEGQPGVSDIRGSADFLIGDNDGTTVSVAMSWMDHFDAESETDLVNGGAMPEGTGADWLNGSGNNTNSNGDTSNDHRLVLNFTRSHADATSSQAFFQLDFSQVPNWGANSLVLESGSVRSMGTAEDYNWWRGTVNFAEGATEAQVVFRVVDDNLVEVDHKLTVTLFDAEHLPEATWASYADFNLGTTLEDTAGIGVTGALPDWNTTIRDPNAYTADVTVTNDDTRLWLDGFSSGGWYDFINNNPWNKKESLEEGNPTWSAAADQAQPGANGELTLNFVRAGAQAADISLGWEVVLNGTASANDFNAALFNAVDINGVTHLVAKANVVLQGSDASTMETGTTITIANFFAPDYTVENNETFQLLFKPTAGQNVLFTPDWQKEAPNSTYYDARLEGQSSMTVNMTMRNDDVTYGIALNSANSNGKVTEGDAGNVVFDFDVSRTLGADRLGGYHDGSSVYWRVVGVGDHGVNADDFRVLPGSSYGVVNGQIVGQVYFSGHYGNDNVGWSAPQDNSDILRTIHLSINPDRVVEYGENFRIELFSPSYGYVDQANDAINGTIVNDDTGVLINDFAVREGDSGDTTVTATVTRIGDLSGSSSMNWTKYNLDTDATDFGTGSFNGSLTLGNGNGESNTLASVDGYGEETKTFNLNLKGDATLEADETFKLFLSNVTGVDQVLDNTAIVTVQNDEAVFSVTSNGAQQGVEGGFTYHFLVTRSNSTPQNETVTWSVVAEGGRNVVNGTDFGGSLPSGQVTFAPGELSKEVTFTASSDLTAEADEVFKVKVTAFGTGAENDTYVGASDGSDKGQIINDDAAIFISDSKPITQIEGSGDANARSYQFDIVRAGPEIGQSSVNWAIVFDGSASADDFTGPTSGTVNFSANGSQTVSVGLNPDTTAEISENFHIVLSNATGSTAIVADANNALGVIGDDDYDLTVANASTAEGDGNNVIQFTITRIGVNGDPSSVDLAAEVDWSLGFTDGQADANDFRAVSGHFTFPAGASTYTLSVPIKGDVQWETDETFSLNLNYDRNNGTTGSTSATGTLTNDDEGFSIAAISPVDEGSTASPGSVTFTVVRSGNTEGDSSVEWSIAGSGEHAASDSDFASDLSGSVSFADGETSKEVTINLVGDDVSEFDETFTVTLANPGPGSSIKAATAVGTITNDDLGYGVSTSTPEVTEGNSVVTDVVFHVSRSGNATALNVDSTVNWAITTLSGDTSALQAADFQEALNGTVSFAAGETSKDVTLHLLGDAAKEDLATLRLSLSNASSGSMINDTADVLVTDDDDQLALAAQQSNTVNEGSDGGYTSLSYLVSRTGSSLGVATVNWSLLGSGPGNGNLSTSVYPINSADIDSVWVDGVQVLSSALGGGTLSFAEGDMQDKLIEVRIKADAVGEFNEQFQLSLSGASYGSTITASSATQNIINDDPTLLLSMANTSITEGNEGSDQDFSFVVTRFGDTTGVSSVAWNIASISGNTVNVDDFGGFLPSGVVNFAPGESSKTVHVLTQGDNVNEPNESFRIQLGAAQNATVVGASSVIATLINDDLGVSVNNVTGSLTEGDAGETTRFDFELAASGTAAASSVTVRWHVEGTGLHPLNAEDFVSGQDRLGGFLGMPSGETTFRLADGEGTRNITINIAGDNVYGPDEQFKVVIDSVDASDNHGNPLGASVLQAEATATVLDDDLRIGLDASRDYSLVEGNNGWQEVRFWVDDLGSSNDSPSMNQVHVAYHITGETDGQDFYNPSANDATLSYDGNSGRYYLGVWLAGDTTVEPNERFVMHLDAAGNGSINGGGVEIAEEGQMAAGTVLGDDYSIALVSPSLVQAEDKARFVFDVLRGGPVDESMDVQFSVGVPDLADGQYGVSANDFIDPATGLPYTGNEITGNLHFDAGQSTARFTLEASHDATLETSERFAVKATVTDIGAYGVSATPEEVAYVDGWINNDDGPVPVDYVQDPQHDVLHHLAA